MSIANMVLSPTCCGSCGAPQYALERDVYLVDTEGQRLPIAPIRRRFIMKQGVPVPVEELRWTSTGTYLVGGYQIEGFFPVKITQAATVLETEEIQLTVWV